MSSPTPSVVVLTPSKIGNSERSAFEQMVRKGGEVSLNTLPDLVDRALALALIRMNDELVGVGAIKRPNNSHRNAVFKLAKVGSKAAQFEYELGWVYVKLSARGMKFGNRLVESLVLQLNGEPAYATSRINNAHMHALLKRYEFRPLGVPYQSKRNVHELQLFVRNA